MPSPGTIFSLGALGGAAFYLNRRNSQSSDTSDNMSPHALARRRSSTVAFDPEWDANKQPEILWCRDNGANFSHNSKPKFPTGQQSRTMKNFKQTSK